MPDWLALLAAWRCWDRPGAWAAGFDVISATTRLEGGVYRLNAQIEYRFSEAALDALQNGVPLTIELEMEVRRRRPWVWDETVYALAQRFRLEYHTLSRQYLVRNLNSGERRGFSSRPAALRFMGQITIFRCLTEACSIPTSAMKALRARLDLDALPTPLRLFAYISEDWRLSQRVAHMATLIRRLARGQGLSVVLGLLGLLVIILVLMSGATTNSTHFEQMYGWLLLISAVGLGALAVLILYNLIELLRRCTAVGRRRATDLAVGGDLCRAGHHTGGAGLRFLSEFLAARY